MIPNTTQVRDISTDEIYKYIGSNQDQVFLFATDFASDANWQDTGSTGDDNWAAPDSNKYDSDYKSDKIYKFVGGAETQVLLSTVDFASDANWEDTGSTGV